MITRPITRPVTAPIARAVAAPGGNLWKPSALFTASEQGIWCDPRDLSTLFQDHSGTAPVTAAGQPIALHLDKSRGLVRGPNLLSTFDFTTWAPINAPTAITQNSFTTSAGGGVRLPSVLVPGSWYEVTVTFTSATSVSLFADSVKFVLTSGVKYLFRSDGTGFFYLRNAGAGTTQVSSMVVRAVPGNHASQTADAARPMLRDTPRRIDYDTVDDALNISFPSSLGSNCTIARSIPGVGAQILTAQTIGTSFTDNVDNCGLVIVNRALTAAETANLTRYLNQRAGL